MIWGRATKELLSSLIFTAVAASYGIVSIWGCGWELEKTYRVVRRDKRLHSNSESAGSTGHSWEGFGVLCVTSCGCQVFETDFVYRAAFSPTVFTVLMYIGNAQHPWNKEKPKACLIIIRDRWILLKTEVFWFLLSLCVFLVLLWYYIDVSTISLSFNDNLKNVGGPEDFHDFHIVQESRRASSCKGGMESGSVIAEHIRKWTLMWIIQGKTHQTW